MLISYLSSLISLISHMYVMTHLGATDHVESDTERDRRIAAAKRAEQETINTMGYNPFKPHLNSNSSNVRSQITGFYFFFFLFLTLFLILFLSPTLTFFSLSFYISCESRSYQCVKCPRCL